MKQLCVKNGQRLFKDGQLLILLFKKRLKVFCPSEDVRQFIAFFSN
jgi:hypothetical protein